jgi:transglutaminase-like putative cysteine protease
VQGARTQPEFEPFLSAGNGSYDQKWLHPGRDCVGQLRVRRFMGEILRAGEKPQEWAALLRDVIADRAPQHGIASFQYVQD